MYGTHPGSKGHETKVITALEAIIDVYPDAFSSNSMPMSLISDFVCAECAAEFKTVFGGDSMWVLREKAGDGSETLNVNGFEA
ncbi:hypothetical protein POTOM_061219 [Populus tomentosa]|uniref:Uncharacterized protein n=1 Tax=Populus tomentosa TaxID=118781 RepID=A0A8X8BVI3_POPTO|nr:hypothetical protein POTOM_061219 [Populus tomentosa]